MGGLIKAITGNAGKKAAKEQAAATLKAADLTATSDRLAAQGAQMGRETLIAQDNAARAAADLLSAPQGTIDVRLADAPPAEIDPTTGRRRTARASFMSDKGNSSGIVI